MQTVRKIICQTIYSVSWPQKYCSDFNIIIIHTDNRPDHSNPFATLIFDFFLDLALVVTRRRRPRQQKVAQVSVTSCWRLADQGRRNELLAGLLMASLTPTILYGTAPCTMPLSFSFHFFFFFLKSI